MIGVLLLSASCAIADSPSNLVLRYKFEESSGTRVEDSSGNGFDGVYVNTPKWTSGVNGTALKLEGGAPGASACYVQLPGGVLKGMDEVTIATWVKWNGEGAWQWLYALGVDTNTYSFLTPQSGSGSLYAATKHGGGEQGIHHDAVLPRGQWKHLAMTVSLTGTSVLYVDGVKTAENTHASIKPAELHDATKSYSGYIGKSFFPDPYFEGEVDDFCIYSTALTAEQISDVYGQSMSAKKALGLVKEKLSIGRTIVSGDIALPSSQYGVEVKWSSSKPSVISTSGKVKRPASGQPVEEVALVATLSKAGQTELKRFKVAVLPAGSDLAFESFNPIFKRDENGNQIFTADPAALVDGDTLYVYAGQDEAPPGAWFTMNRWVCYSTKDLVHWKCEGVVLNCSDISWGAPGTAWACHVVKRNGKYYFYTTSGLPNGKGFTIGVLVSDSPTGPFVDLKGKPLIDNAITTGGPVDSIEDIDPTVFVDDDGEAYIYWGNRHLHYALLNDDMMSLKDLNNDGKISEGADIFTNVAIKGTSEDSFGEAPWLYKANDKYYLVYAGSMPQYVRYAMSDSPRGPWTFAGTIVSRNVTPDGGNGDDNSGTCHPAVIDFKGQSYVLYHNAALPAGGQHRRSVCVERMFYNEDGSIKFVPTTSTGLTGKASRILSRHTGHFVIHSGYDIVLVDNASQEQSSAWELVIGLHEEATVDMVSIQAVSQPGYYLAIDGNRVVLAKNDNSEGFKERATFRKVPGLGGKDGISFQSAANPSLYLSSRNAGIIVTKEVVTRGSEDARQAATFEIR